MKDKLRELVVTMRASSESGTQSQRQIIEYWADRFAAMLDADGDGGAVGDGLRALLGEKKLYVMHPENVQDEHLPFHEISFGMVLDDKVLFTSQATHPTRSGVVSDEGVRDALNIFVGGNQYTSDHQCQRMRAALESYERNRK